jgi:transcriptional regulator with GAF, ATPase, and Fis domain
MESLSLEPRRPPERPDTASEAELSAIAAGFVGHSHAIRTVMSDMAKVARTRCAVLIEGESGTGKELAARHIHDLSTNREGPFEAVNCGAIPDMLVESELFGHVAGAFTGAIRNHRGAFERAGAGTVFLDEVGELPLGAQVKLLRVLQEQTFRPVGGEKLLPVRCRIVAASNRDLRGEVRQGRLREDLYYRLNVFPIRLPALRDRREDIPLLVDDFLCTLATELGCARPRIEPLALQRLLVYSYPGNVRELQNLVRTLIIEAQDAGEILDRHVVDLFRRHRIEDFQPDRAGHHDGNGSNGSAPAEDAGEWVIGQLRRFDFNIALAERKLKPTKYALAGDGRRVACSRSGLTYYLQGEWFRALPQESWDQRAVALRLAGQPDLADRLLVKLDHFLKRSIDAMQSCRSAGSRLRALKHAFPKLPVCYNADLARFVADFPDSPWGG